MLVPNSRRRLIETVATRKAGTVGMIAGIRVRHIPLNLRWCNGNTRVFGTLVLGSSPSRRTIPILDVGTCSRRSKRFALTTATPEAGA